MIFYDSIEKKTFTISICWRWFKYDAIWRCHGEQIKLFFLHFLIRKRLRYLHVFKMLSAWLKIDRRNLIKVNWFITAHTWFYLDHQELSINYLWSGLSVQTNFSILHKLLFRCLKKHDHHITSLFGSEFCRYIKILRFGHN